MTIRSFSSQFDDNTAHRSIDNDAPSGLRQEFIDAVYLILESPTGPFDAPYVFDQRNMYNIIMQCLGSQPAGNPMSGFRHAIGREVGKAPWERFYDLIIRIAAEVPERLKGEYRQHVNQLLASYRIAWVLGEDDQLHCVLPIVVATHVEAAFRELSQPRFAAAFTSFQDGMAAYDGRPQRGRDACKNIFDSLEAVAKVVYGMPTGTFGDVLKKVRSQQSMASETIACLEKLNVLANAHFRHGMTSPFALKTAEVDYVLVSCLGAILLFIRL